MKRIISACILLTTLIGGAYAQANDAAFKVLATRGANKLKINASTTKDLKAGLSINSDASIEVASNGMVGLMYKNGRTLELKNAGVYPVTDLVKQALNKSSSSVSSQYAKYVLAQVTKGNNDPVSSTPGKNMGVTGAVMRSAPGTKSATIGVYIPATEILAESTPTIHWSKVNGASGYTVRLMDLENNVLLTQEVADTTSSLNLASVPTLKDETIVVVKVESKGKNQHSAIIPLHISKLDPDSKAEYNDISQNLDKSSATDWISLALFCQRFNLNADAYHAFEMATTLAPDVAEYKTMFKDFITQVNLKETMNNR